MSIRTHICFLALVGLLLSGCSSSSGTPSASDTEVTELEVIGKCEVPWVTKVVEGDEGRHMAKITTGVSLAVCSATER